MGYFRKKFSLTSRVVVLFFLILCVVLAFFLILGSGLNAIEKKRHALSQNSFEWPGHVVIYEDFADLQHEIWLQQTQDHHDTESLARRFKGIGRQLQKFEGALRSEPEFSDQVFRLHRLSQQWDKIAQEKLASDDLPSHVRQMQIDVQETLDLSVAKLNEQQRLQNDELVALTKAVWNKSLLAGGVGFVLVAVFAFLILRAIRSTIRELVEFSQNVARGSLDQKLVVEGNQEIADLVAAYNNMTENLELASGILEEQDQRKDEFVSVASHELRTPIAILQHAIGNLKSGVVGQLNADQANVLKIAENNVNRLGKMIAGLLDMARLESGRQKVNLSQVNLNQTLADFESGFATLAQQENKSVQFVLARDLPLVRADADLIVQVVTNFFNNALRYASQTIRIQTAPAKLGSKPGVQVSVIDDGPGLTPENQAKLFQKFSQIDRKTDASGYRGTGLGLAINKQIIEQHQGVIGVKSQVGVGSEFYFILPVS